MAFIKIRTGKRGRPAALDTKLYIEAIEDLYRGAAPRLAQIRQSSKGYRGEELLGSATSVPDWVAESVDILYSAEYGREPTPAEFKSIKSTLRSLKQLASPRRKVAERGLGEKIEDYFLNQFEKLSQIGTRVAKRKFNTIKQKLQSMTAAEKTELLTSKAFQDPKAVGRYKRVRAWANKQTGKNLSYADAWAYALADRISKGLNI